MPPRSSRSPTSSPARPWSRPASAPARCRSGCCARSAPSGTLLSFERREEFAEVAQGNVASFLGASPTNWTVDRRRPRRGAARHAVEPGIRRPRRARHARPLGVPRRRAPTRSRPAACCSATSPPSPSCRASPRRSARTGLFTDPESTRDDGARLARRGTRRAPRPPDGRPHRLPAHRPPARARRGAARS